MRTTVEMTPRNLAAVLVADIDDRHAAQGGLTWVTRERQIHPAP
jgi:hypothetical protein